MIATHSQPSLLHRTFRAGITLKGVDGLLESVAGVVLLVNPAVLRNLSLKLWTYGHFLHSHPSAGKGFAHQLAATDPTFAAFYLLAHGLVKIALVVALWMNRLWAYPLAIFVFAAFAIYQVFRLTHVYSIGLVLLTIADVAIIYLTVLEYRDQKRLRKGRTAAE